MKEGKSQEWLDGFNECKRQILENEKYIPGFWYGYWEGFKKCKEAMIEKGKNFNDIKEKCIHVFTVGERINEHFSEVFCDKCGFKPDIEGLK